MMNFPFALPVNAQNVLQCGNIICNLLEGACQQAFERFVNLTEAQPSTLRSDYSEWIDAVCWVSAGNSTEIIYANYLFPCINVSFSSAVRNAFEVSYAMSEQCLHPKGGESSSLYSAMILIATLLATVCIGIQSHKCVKKRNSRQISAVTTNSFPVEAEAEESSAVHLGSPYKTLPGQSASA